MPVLEGKPETTGRGSRFLHQPRIFDLRQVNKLAVVAEVSREQFGMPVEPEAARRGAGLSAD